MIEDYKEYWNTHKLSLSTLLIAVVGTFLLFVAAGLKNDKLALISVSLMVLGILGTFFVWPIEIFRLKE